jgi:hypothetical protein
MIGLFDMSTISFKYLRKGLIGSNRPIIVTMLTIRTDLYKQIKQIYYRYCANYLKGIVDKSDRSIIFTVLAINV